MKNIHELVQSITFHDMNKRMEHLISRYQEALDVSYLNNASAIKMEFMEYWNSQLSEFCPSAEE